MSSSRGGGDSDNWARSRDEKRGTNTAHEQITGRFSKKPAGDDDKITSTPDMYFLDTKKFEMDPRMSKTKGYEYNYPLPLEARGNPLLQEMIVMKNVNQFMAETHMHKLPIMKYPGATKRLTGVSLDLLLLSLHD